MEYTFSNRPWVEGKEGDKSAFQVERNVVGFHVPGRFDKVLPVKKCYLQQDPSNAIRDHILEFSQTHGCDHFDNRTFSGFLRNVIIRCNRNREFMVILSFGRDVPEWSSLLLTSLREKFPSIISLYSVVNTKKNPTLLDQAHVLHSGTPYLVERICGCDFLVGPKSFFQSNAFQTEKLYQIVLDYAQLTSTDTVYDLYCGTGTIACVLAKHCRSVVGVELVMEAVEDANRNAEANKIGNVHFVTGDVKDVVEPAFSARFGKPDVVVVDPPRPGLHEDVIAVLLELAPSRIVYVSCNPETQKRDVQLLGTRYRLAKLKPVDMVPRTRHVENVVLLEREDA
jgi:23S rRNA (uracil1939-C5)-methyltransferase